jgi:hypothetical protein
MMKPMIEIYDDEMCRFFLFLISMATINPQTAGERHLATEENC